MNHGSIDLSLYLLLGPAMLTYRSPEDRDLVGMHAPLADVVSGEGVTLIETEDIGIPSLFDDHSDVRHGAAECLRQRIHRVRHHSLEFGEWDIEAARDGGRLICVNVVRMHTGVEHGEHFAFDCQRRGEPDDFLPDVVRYWHRRLRQPAGE